MTTPGSEAAHGHTVERDQIQKLVARGYTFHRMRLLLLRVQDAAAARSFLRALHLPPTPEDKPWLVAADAGRDSVNHRVREQGAVVSLGISYAGLLALQLGRRWQTVFMHQAKAFYAGAPRRASTHLGDFGPSAPDRWEAAYAHAQTHVVLCLHGDDVAGVDRALAQLRQKANIAFQPEGWSPAAFEEGAHLSTDRMARRVHFGYLDGISNPAFEGLGDKREPQRDLNHQPGELLLGYRNDYDKNPWLLPFEPGSDIVPTEPGDPPERTRLAAWFRNGSFCALRKIEQDEAAFRGFVAEWAARNANAGDSARTEAWLRAKLVGRWDDGQVVRPVMPPADELTPPSGPAPRELNDFSFGDDPLGRGCPFGAHIRRTNPRADAVVPYRRRPMLRRGIPYGVPYDANEKPGSVRRGLLGLFFCADLEDQFEHVLREWVDMNPMGTPSTSRAKDPIIGNHEDARAAFDIPRADRSITQVRGFQAFTRTRGTLYLFFPGLNALESLDDPTVFGPDAQ